MDNENKNPLLPEEKAFPAEGMSETETPEGSKEEQSSGEMPVAPPSQEEPEEDFSREEQEAPKSDLEAIEKGTSEQLPPETMEPPIAEDSIKKQKKPRKDSHKGKYRGISLAMTAGFLAVIILLNVVVSLLGERYPSINLDLTEGHVNTLSESAAEIASNVQNPTTIYIMASEEIAKADTLLAEYGIKYSQVSTLAEKMAEKNSNISVEYIDLDQNPAFASEYKDDGLMTADVLVKTDKRYRVLAYTDLFDVQYSQTGMTAYSMVDSALASAVSSVNADTLPLAVFDTGHN